MMMMRGREEASQSLAVVEPCSMCGCIQKEEEHMEKENNTRFTPYDFIVKKTPINRRS